LGAFPGAEDASKMLSSLPDAMRDFVGHKKQLQKRTFAT